jgi:hypothetical protein
MELKMFLNGSLLAIAPINSSITSLRGCVENIMLDLEEKYEDVIDASGEEPQYFLDNIPSSMNYFIKKKFQD